jgi:CheY-like chemotaxis protein
MTAEVEAPPPKPKADDALSALNVLVVEDNDLVRARAAEMVRRAGCRTYVAANALQAMEVIRSNCPIELLFTDIVMPGGVNGLQLASEAKRIRPDLKVLFTSGYSSAEVEFGSAVAVGGPLLRKPYKSSDLANAMRRAAAAPI